MKKSIDPNLNNNDGDIIELLSSSPIEKSEFHLSDDFKKSDDLQFSFATDEDNEIDKEREEFFNKIIEKSDEQSGHTSHHSSQHHSSSHHSHHHSSHHRHHKHKKKLPIALRIVLCLILVIVIVIASVLGFFALEVNKGDFTGETIVTTDDVYDEILEYNGKSYKYNENIIALAFIGVDQDDLKTADETDFVGAADADIVFAIDTETGKASVISVPRDTMVDIDIYDTNGKFTQTKNAQLCLAYSYGDGNKQSCINSVNAISRVLYNVPIQKYFVLDLTGIPVLNDAIGGVTLESQYDIEEYGIKKGETVTLIGEASTAYVRTRDMDNIEASLNRTERQIQYVKAYSQQLLPAVKNDFGVISELYNSVKNYSMTDVELDNLTYIASILLSKGITSFDTYSLQGEMKASQDTVYADIVHAEFYPSEESIMDIVTSVFYTQVSTEQN